MPRTGRHFPSGLTIDIDDLQATYLPGDTVTGRIVFSAPPSRNQPPPNGVKISFFGRAKTKYVIRTTNGTSIYRGRAVLVDVDVTPSCQLTTGHAGELTWPFVLTIPTHTQEGLAARGNEWRDHNMFLATKTRSKGPIDVTEHPLPAVMYHHAKSNVSGKTSEAYVEYVLLANVGRLKATMPLFLRARSTDVPIENFKPQINSTLQLIRSPRLLEEHARSDLTFRQKTSRLFRPSHTPRYVYSVKVECPTLIQLEHPEPIPLKMAIVPNLDPEQTTICPDGDLQSLPPIHLISIGLELQMRLDIRCPGTFYDHENDKQHTIEIPFPGILGRRPLPVIPASDLGQHMSGSVSRKVTTSHVGAVQQSSDTPSKELGLSANVIRDPKDADRPETGLPPPPYTSTPTEPLNLGKHFSIFIGSSACSTMGRPPVSFKRQLYPTFKTYNIRLTYQLRWKMRLECAGETTRVEGQNPITILPPSEEQEALKARELGIDGMKKNYDDLEAGLLEGLQFIGDVLSLVGG